MEFKNIRLQGKAGIDFAVSNEFPNKVELEDAILDATSTADLLNRLSKINSYIKKFSLHRETTEYIRIQCIPYMCDNEYFLTIYKKPNVDANRKKILIQLMTSWLVFHPQAFKDIITYCEQAGHGFTKEEIYKILHVSDDYDK